MDRRLQLQTLLEEISEYPEDRVYFQPSENTTMQYPCITYSRDNSYRASADNHGYRVVRRYQVTLINRDPDNPIFDPVSRLPQASHERSFVVDGLNHDVFQLYF